MNLSDPNELFVRAGEQVYRQGTLLDELKNRFQGRNIIIRNHDVEVKGRLLKACREGLLVQISRNQDVFLKEWNEVILP